MPRIKLTEMAIGRIKAPPKPQQVDYWDSLTPGFGLRVSYSGTKAWVSQVRILVNGEWKQTRIGIDIYPRLGLADARAKAREIQEMARSGKDPRHVKLRAKQEMVEESRNTYSLVCERFFVQHCDQNMKASSAKEFRRVLTKYFESWNARPITQISKRDVIERIDSIVLENGPIMANRSLQYLKTLMNWAADKEIFPADQVLPTDRVRKPTEEKEGQRYLSNAEIILLWRVLDKEPIYGPMLKLLLLLGQRRTEVAEMPWSELTSLDIESPHWDIPGERTKNGRPHRVPLSEFSIEILKSVPRVSEKFVFSTNGRTPTNGFSGAKERIDEAILKIKDAENLAGVFERDWNIHDLRRTAATKLAELGTSRDVVELILNHRSGTRAGVAGIYNRSELMTERRRALSQLADHIHSLVQGPIGGKAIQFARPAANSYR